MVFVNMDFGYEASFDFLYTPCFVQQRHKRKICGNIGFNPPTFSHAFRLQNRCDVLRYLGVGYFPKSVEYFWWIKSFCGNFSVGSVFP